ncbi:MAG: hypothetical protein ACK4RK_08470 [Gemmataceae bacterium]
MADKATQMIVDALSRAVADPAGLPLHGTKTATGLFPTTSPARQAAQRCKDEGFLQVIKTETKGKNTNEVCALTEKGLTYLLKQVSPKHVLEDLVRALESRQRQVSDLIQIAQQTQAAIEAFQNMAQQALTALPSWLAQLPSSGSASQPTVNGYYARWLDGATEDACSASLYHHLQQWQATGTSEDCPLPELYQRIQHDCPGASIGLFHDCLRRLHEQELIYLHPWTGPRYAIPEPSHALLIGHEVAYYASIRK